MTAARPTPSATRTRVIALCGTGAFVLVAGALLPRMLTLPPMTQETASTAAEAPAAPAATPSLGELVPADMRPLVERVLVAASVVTLVGVGLMWLARRRGRAELAAAPGLLNVTAALQLPHHCCAYLIRVGDRQFLAGVDAGGIRSVVPLPTPPADDEDDAESAAHNSLAAPLRVIA